jgi:hypothetical protein
MLFLFFLAAISGSSGWMLTWAILGIIVSSRPSHLFFLPIAAAALHRPELGEGIVLLTWAYLIWQSIERANARNELRQAIDGLAEQLPTSSA